MVSGSELVESTAPAEECEQLGSENPRRVRTFDGNWAKQARQVNCLARQPSHASISSLLCRWPSRHKKRHRRSIPGAAFISLKLFSCNVLSRVLCADQARTHIGLLSEAAPTPNQPGRRRKAVPGQRFRCGDPSGGPATSAAGYVAPWGNGWRGRSGRPGSRRRPAPSGCR